MDTERFKQLIEAPLFTVESAYIKSLIHRTIRLCLQYPNEAKEYYDSLPKADSKMIPTPSNK